MYNYEEFYLEEFRLSVWYDIPCRNFLFIDAKTVNLMFWIRNYKILKNFSTTRAKSNDQNSLANKQISIDLDSDNETESLYNRKNLFQLKQM